MEDVPFCCAHVHEWGDHSATCNWYLEVAA